MRIHFKATLTTLLPVYGWMEAPIKEIWLASNATPEFLQGTYYE